MFYFYSYSHDKIRKEASKFYQNVVALGMVYLLSDPFVILSCFFLQEYNRQYYYRFIDQLIHIAVQAFLFYQMSASKTSF